MIRTITKILQLIIVNKILKCLELFQITALNIMLNYYEFTGKSIIKIVQSIGLSKSDVSNLNF